MGHEPQMTIARTRLLTLCYGDMETIRMLPPTYIELDALARDWTKPPPDAIFTLRVPVEYASLHAARLVSGPYIYLTSEDSFQIATMGVQGLRVEIVSDGPPPEEEPEAPPPPPVLEMPATFSLELTPGQHVALDTIVSSDELDMARMEDGTTVDGIFWGKLNIVHDGDNHSMEFSGTRIPNESATQELVVDTKVISKLATVAKPPTARCHLSIIPPAQQYCDIVLTTSPYWTFGTTWPPAEVVEENKVKYFLRVNPGGGMEHFQTGIVTTSLYYEASPDASMLNPQEFIAPRNSFAMPIRDFLMHIINVLDQLGLSIQARTNFINHNMSAFSAYSNVAYRFLSPAKISSAIDISVTADQCVFTRLFFLFRGVSEDEMGNFITSGEKEANQYNWRDVVGWSEFSKDSSHFRVLEISAMEL